MNSKKSSQYRTHQFIIFIFIRALQLLASMASKSVGEMVSVSIKYKNYSSGGNKLKFQGNVAKSCNALINMNIIN